jgi:2-aminophenol/2-amino-5-chlorophenol 1,6-dioxygenase alpha subunit
VSAGRLLAGYIVPGRPHPLLAPERCEAWGRLRAAFEAAREEIAELAPDLLLLYSTQWPSILGHQIQADPAPKWTLVDQEWHDLGSIPYELRIDPEFARAYCDAAKARGLHTRTVAYHGFPVDTGSVVALKLLDPEGRIPASIVSCNVYADRAETLVLGKAARDAVERSGRTAVAVAVTALSNRIFTRPIRPEEDRISSVKDDEWNRKVVEILEAGRLEDVSQHAREVYAQANADQKFKAIWWLAALMGQNNDYRGHVHEYQPLVGSGAAVVSLTPRAGQSATLEFDEADVEVFAGDRNVLARREPAPAKVGTSAPAPSTDVVHAAEAPRPVGAFPHARRVGDLLFLSGMGPRTPGNDEVPGGAVWDGDPSQRLDYDIEAQTRAVIENLRTVLRASGAELEDVVDVQCFLIDMERDFETFNRVYAETFEAIEATRTTLQVDRLPTPIAVEFKVVARLRS